MPVSENLNFGFSAKTPLILQAEATECGLACIGMIASHHGHRTNLMELRARFSVSLKGTTLVDLIRIAQSLELSARPVKLDMDGLPQLRLPCILHWNFNHFVVLTEVSRKTITIHDPAVGVRKISFEDVSKQFTGVALELWPSSGFQKKSAEPKPKLASLMGTTTGWKRSMAHILTLAMALEVFALLSPLYLQWVIDNVIVSADLDLLMTLALGFTLLFLMQQVVVAIRSWGIIYLSTTLKLQWRTNVFTHLLRLPVQYFERRHLGDVLSRFGAIDQIEKTLTTSFLEAILDGLMTLATLAMMLVYSPILAGISVAAMTLYGVSRWVWYWPLRKASEENIVHAAKQQSHILETLRGVKTIKLFQRQQERRSAWMTLFVDTVNSEIQIQKLTALFSLINGVTAGLENIVVIGLGADMVLKGSFTVGVLMVFNAYRLQFDGRVTSLIDKYFEFKMLNLQAERLADIVVEKPEYDQSGSPHWWSDELVAAIDVRNLKFRYADHEPFILDGVSLRIEAGESVAITGQSGCGKTTLLNVLLGILTPTEGEVVIGNVEIEKVGIEVLRNAVGTVLQDDVLFAGSIAENISFFDSQMDWNRIKECARHAAIAKEVESMQMGYNTLVGDMGTILSGGQKQRVLLARALYKRPRILFLDEATSHLDIVREREVNEAIRALNITRVIVAHRPETIASASRVIALHEGKIIRDMKVNSTAQIGASG